MSRQYLDLCRALVAELGVAGGTGPSGVTGQSGEFANIVQWVGDADIYVQNLWQDWKFLWSEGPIGQSLPIGDGDITTVTDILAEVEEGLVLHSGTSQAYRPKWMPYPDFRVRYLTTPKQNAAKPTNWSVRPDGIVVLSHNVTQITPWTLEYHRRPERMVDNTNQSPIPTHFDRIILARAAVIYGGREDAPEIIASYTAEYVDALEKMESAYLPGQRNHRRSQNRGQPEPDFLGRG